MKTRLRKQFYLWLFLFSASATMAQTPVMTWDFETIRNRLAIEESTNIADTIEGHFEGADGVIGNGCTSRLFTRRKKKWRYM
jgi:hypothetical protein